jgi:dTDP-4-dehydrorhamnose reductase
MTTSIVIFGAGGQLGSALRKTAPQSVTVTPLGRGDVDIRDGGAVERVLQAARPTVVFNCAA